MDAEGFVATVEARRENEVGFICGAEITNKEVGKDGSSCVEGGSIGFILGVPVVFALGKLLGRVFGAKGEVTLCFIRFALWLHSERGRNTWAIA